MYSIYFKDLPTDGSSDIYKNGKDDMQLVYANGYFSDKYRVVNPRFNMSIGNAGELTFTMLPPDKLYDKQTRDQLENNPLFKPLRTYVYIYDTNLPDGSSKCMWRGRIVSADEDFYGNKNITCEGELSFINDVIFPPHSYGNSLPDNDPVQTHKYSKQTPNQLFSIFIKYYNRHITKDLLCINGYFWYTYEPVMAPKDASGNYITDPDISPFYAYKKIVDDVWAGKYGNGDDRKILLAQAGHDYDLIQALVGLQHAAKPGDTGYRALTPGNINGNMLKAVMSTEYKPLLEVFNEHLCSPDDPHGYLQFTYGSYVPINNRGEEDTTATVTGKYLDVDFFPRLNYMRYDDMTRKTDQIIAFGENLLDLNSLLDTTNIFTVVTPLGAMQKRFRCSCHTGFTRTGVTGHHKPEDDVEDTHSTAVIDQTILLPDNGDTDDALKRHFRWYHPGLPANVKNEGEDPVYKTIANMTKDEFDTAFSSIKETYITDEGSERINIADVNDKFQYIPKATNWANDNLVKIYGLRSRIIEFDTVTDKARLLYLGAKYRSMMNLVNSISLTAVDLKLVGVDVDAIRLGYSIRILSPVHGLDLYMQCTQVSLDFDNPANNSYTFGKTITGITDKQVALNKRTTKG